MMSRQTSSPIKSASVSGPMGCAIPSLKTSSTASGVATPSITAYMASLRSGISTRFETNPGASFTSTGVLSSVMARVRTRSNVACDVASPRITSTSFITGTGLKKCIPMTCPGRLVSAPSFVIEMDDVFEAGAIQRRRDAPQGGRLLLDGDLFLRPFPRQVLADHVERAVEKPLLHVVQQHLVSAARKDVGDAVTHRARAHHTDPLDLHGLGTPARCLGICGEPKSVADCSGGSAGP